MKSIAARANGKAAGGTRAARRLRARLAFNLKRRRADLELSQELAAEAAGFSLQYFQRIERSIVNVPLDTVARLALALKVEPEELLRPSLR